MAFEKATRRKAKLRLGLDGPSGSGKSFTGMRFAITLANHYGLKVGAIDTERGSLSLYEGYAPDGVKWEFDVNNLTGFSPDQYTSAINEAARLKYGVLFIDSLTHAWAGPGGALDIHGDAGGKYYDWRSVSPLHNRMVDAILQYPGHVIATIRSKQEYVQNEEIVDGKKKYTVEKLGMKPIQREGMEYEFTMFGSMDMAHMLKITKSRCSIVENIQVHKPGPDFMRPVIDWLETGTTEALPAAVQRLVSEKTVEEIQAVLAELKIPESKTMEVLKTKFGVGRFQDLTQEQADTILKEATANRDKKKQREQEKAAAAVKAAATNNGEPTVTTPTTTA